MAVRYWLGAARPGPCRVEALVLHGGGNPEADRALGTKRRSPERLKMSVVGTTPGSIEVQFTKLKMLSPIVVVVVVHVW